jgi:6-phosphogluconolactonase
LKLEIFEDEASWHEEILKTFRYSVLTELAATGSEVHVLLSGGTTPMSLYTKMGMLALPWHKLRFWLADERCVGLDSPHRNEFAIRQAFGREWPKVSANFMSWGATSEPEASARAYEGLLRSSFPSGPKFAIFLAGVGDDGHTASLFPDSPYLLNGSSSLTIATSKEYHKHRRLSLTPSALKRSQEIVVLLRGIGKATVASALRADDPKFLACQILGPNARVLWCVPGASSP